MTASNEKVFTLSFIERLTLASLLPEKGSYAGRQLNKAIYHKLVPESELKARRYGNILKCNICGNQEIVPNFEDSKVTAKRKESKGICQSCTGDKPGKMIFIGKVGWSDEDDKGKSIPDIIEVSLGEMACSKFETYLKELDEAEVLEDRHDRLYEIFVLDKRKGL